MKSKKATVVPELDEGACIYGATVLLKHLNAMDKETEGIRSGAKDIEFIHRARVATRRLRAAIPLFESCFSKKKIRSWSKQIRTVTRALGEARDVDVQLERVQAVFQKLPEDGFKPGVARLILRLRQRRMKLESPVSEAMQSLQESDLIESMRQHLEGMIAREAEVFQFTPVLYQHSFQSIEKRLQELLAYDEIVFQPEKIAELHQMRIAAKWLRYTIETFASLYAGELKPYLQAVRKAQELLGDIHDCDVWIAFLPQFYEEERLRTIDYFGSERLFKEYIPGLQYFENNRQEARKKFYDTFTCEWKRWQEAGLWESLREAVQVPFSPDSPIFPPLRGSEEDQT